MIQLRRLVWTKKYLEEEKNFSGDHSVEKKYSPVHSLVAIKLKFKLGIWKDNPWKMNLNWNNGLKTRAAPNCHCGKSANKVAEFLLG